MGEPLCGELTGAGVLGQGQGAIRCSRGQRRSDHTDAHGEGGGWRIEGRAAVRHQ